MIDDDDDDNNEEKKKLTTQQQTMQQIVNKNKRILPTELLPARDTQYHGYSFGTTTITQTNVPNQNQTRNRFEWRTR